MSDLAGLQITNGPASPVGSQDKGLASKQEGGPETFLKTLNEVAESEAPPESVSNGIPNGQNPPISMAEDEHPVLQFPGMLPLGSKWIEPIDQRDEEIESGPFLAPADPALNLFPGLALLQAGLVQNAPLEGSLPPVSPGEGVGQEGAEQQQVIGIQALMGSEVPEALSGTHLSPQADPSAPEGVDLLPTGFVEGPQSDPSDTAQKAESVTVSSQQGDLQEGLSLVGQGTQAALEKISRQETAKNQNSTSPACVAPNGHESKGAHSHKVESVGALGKENALLSTSSGESRGGSEEGGTTLRPERPIPSGILANERVGTNAAGDPSFGLHESDPFEGVRSAGAIQSKTPTGALSQAGMPDEKLLLHQIAEKWTVSHANNEHSFRLQLEPETLGTLQIDISVHEERVVAEIVTKHPFVKELREGNQESLRGTLAEQGLKVDRFSVSLGNPGQASLGWENHLRQRGTESGYYPSEQSFLRQAEEGEISPEQRRMKEGVWSAINIYV